jgi:hypothetical protein
MNNNKSIILCFAALFLILAIVGGVSATTLNVATTGTDSGDCTTSVCLTIGYAISQATTGDTIQVAAGTYDEQVVIDKNLTLQGAGDTTIVKPSAAATLTQFSDGLFWFGGTKNIAGIIVANVPDGSNVTIKNLKVDESSVATKPTGADYLTGIFYRETGGTVDTVSIVGGGVWIPDRAYGIYLSAATNTVTVEVKGSTITNYDKNGIDVHGNKLTANIHHNTITGRGSVSDEAQNGVNVGRDAAATVNYNTISNLVYSSAGAVATGILVYHYVTPTGKSATAVGNTITDCQVGIMFKNANGIAQNNTVNGGTVGLDGIFAQPNYVGAYTASFENNTVSGIKNNAAIDVETFAITLTPGNGATLTATIRNNTLTGGYTTADGIYVGGSAGSVTATISGNTISGWPEHGINLGDACVAGATITSNNITSNALRGVNIAAAVNAANVHINSNNIVGNTAYGVKNEGTGSLDAENNYWGDSNPNFNTIISGSVDYTPWYLDSGLIQLSGQPACTPGATETETCGISVGECRAGTKSRTCDAGGLWGSYSVCGGTYVGPATESIADGTCSDGKDNDCDGYTDSFDSDCSASPEYYTKTELGDKTESNSGAGLIGFFSTWAETVKDALNWLHAKITSLAIADILNLQETLNTKQNAINSSNKLEWNLIANSPTKLSYFSNDVGYITSYTETDPTLTLDTLKELVSNDFHNLGGLETDPVWAIDKASYYTKTEINTNVTELRGNINTESNARQDIDTKLQSNISTEEERAINAEDTLTTNLNTEATLRQENDTSLKTNISALHAEDANLQNQITSNDADILALQGGLGNEIIDRQDNDTKLQTHVTSLEERAPQNTNGVDIYLTQGWNKFKMPWFVLNGTAQVNGLNVNDNFSVQNVLNIGGINGKYSYLAYYNGKEWQTYVQGDVNATTFTKFPSTVTTADYTFYIYMEEGARLTIGLKSG